MRLHTFYLYSLLLSFCLTPNLVFAEAIKVEVLRTGDKYSLYRDGKPYTIKGVGLVDDNLARVADYGANSIRTWSVDSNAMPAGQLLDMAHELGLTVSLCLEFARERQGFDYNDPEAVLKQFNESKARVLKYKDHPALLMWMIGNELNFDYTNPKVYDAAEDVAKMIKELDPNHPVTTPIAGFDRNAMRDIEERAPHIDFVSFQMYADLANLPTYLKDMSFNKPFMVTEWGAVGHWEVFKTEWGAPVENTSSEKAQNYVSSYQNVLSSEDLNVIGNYVFFWGQKQEKTPTWYGMFLSTGEETEPVDVMYQIWNEEWPENRAPQISTISIEGRTAFDNVRLDSGKEYTALITVQEPEEDEVKIAWEVREESVSQKVGGDAEYVPNLVEGVIKGNNNTEISIVAPSKEGAYRLFVYVYDPYGNAAHANFPFYAQSSHP